MIYIGTFYMFTYGEPLDVIRMITHSRRNEKIVLMEHGDVLRALENKLHENRYRLGYFPRELWNNRRSPVEVFETL